MIILKITHELKNTFNILIKKVFTHISVTTVIFKLFYFLTALFILYNISTFCYKAWLYPIRTNQYFDECSYISMGKFFRTISPLNIFTKHILKNEPLPKLYEEFNCRLIYWPIVLSIPLKYTEDRIELHKFRAFLMVLGTIIFFLIGHKLSGIVGGVLASAFWTSTPLLNYWGHFFMTENPSFIFLATGFLLLLYSDRFSIAAFLGGMLLGFAGLTRFTTLAIALPAPFIIIGVYFHPLKRKSFQILGELAKAFSGFIFIVLPYLIFTWWIFRNPLVPFLSARFAVNSFPVDDSLYYIKNLWIESGIFLKTGVLLSFFSPLLLSFSIMLRKIIKESTVNKLKKNIFQVIYDKIKTFNYIRVFGSSLIYYIIIYSSLIITTAIYLTYITEVPHKLPRYLMGAIIPLIILASAGYGSIEPLIISIFRFTGASILTGLKGINKKYFIKKVLIILPWGLGFIGCLIILYNITIKIWNHQMDRQYDISYVINKNVENDLLAKKDSTSLKRLQPEYLEWQDGIHTRLNKIAENETAGIDETDYHEPRYRSIIKYLNENAKGDEVLYVDRLNFTPYTPAYTELPAIYIESLYNNTIDQLIRKGEMPYKGYVLINNNANNDIFKENGDFFVRSLNKIQIGSNKKFSLIKKFGHESLYLFEAKPFNYNFGTKDRISRLYKNNAKLEDKIVEKKKSFISEIRTTLNNLFNL